MIFFIYLVLGIYIIGAVGLAVMNYIAEVANNPDDMGVPVLWNPHILKHSALFGILWPYYIYKLNKEDE